MIAGLAITYQVAGVDQGPAVLERISAAFERTGDELADFSKHVFPRLTPLFEAESRRQFDAQGGGPRGGWAALSPGYARWKEEHYPGKTILRRTDALYQALTESSSVFAERVMSGEQFDFGTRGVEYASFHQLGTGSMVDRPPFDFSPDFEADLAREALEAAREAVQAAGLDEFAELRP